MRFVVLLVMFSLGFAGLAQPAQCWLSPIRDGISTIHGHVTNIINGLVSPFKQTTTYNSIRDFWNSDMARPMRDRFDEYKERAFESFAEAFGRRYNQTELPKRMQAFLETFNNIESWHSQYEQGKVSYDLEVNHLADLTQDELASLNKLAEPQGFKNQLQSASQVLESPTNSRKLSLPSSSSWQNWMPKIRDQGSCGSCYAFATADVMTVAKARADGDYSYPNKEYSVQQLVDCSHRDNGCNGGWPSQTLDYIKSTGGLAIESEYPYKAKRGYCLARSLYSSSPRLTKLQGPEYKILTSEDQFQEHIATTGPVIAAMHASGYGFSYYSKGIFEDPSCGTRNWNHAVVVAGYGTEGGKDYWLIRNSYGEDWGDKGYMKMVRGKNMCKIGKMGWGVTKT